MSLSYPHEKQVECPYWPSKPTPKQLLKKLELDFLKNAALILNLLVNLQPCSFEIIVFSVKYLPKRKATFILIVFPASSKLGINLVICNSKSSGSFKWSGNQVIIVLALISHFLHDTGSFILNIWCIENPYV